jgi:hypothetical protein
MADVTPVEPPRIRRFRLNLCKEIPRFPNDKASLEALEEKSLGSLFIDYINWKVRYIAPRPRAASVEQSALSDPRWTPLLGQIDPVLEAVATGTDLTPYLSLQPHSRGFTPASSVPGPDTDKWADKDMLLNIMGYHHLHLDAAPTAGMRSDDCIFAHATRDAFVVVGLFNHSVFEPTQFRGTITAERERLWTIYNERLMRDVAPGSVVIGNPIATSGHSVSAAFQSMHYARTVTNTDPLLDDPAYVAGLYQRAGLEFPRKPKLQWHMHYLDLGLLDLEAAHFWNCVKGPN